MGTRPQYHYTAHTLLCWLRLFMRRFYSVQTETNLHENAHNANVCNKNTLGTQRQRNKLQKPQKPNSENLFMGVIIIVVACISPNYGVTSRQVSVCVAVRRGDGHGRVQLPLGGHDVQAPGQLSEVQCSSAQCSSAQCVAPCSSGNLARAWEMEFNWKYLKGARKIVQFVCK